MQLVLIRHGEAETIEYDANGADPALSPLGRKQAAGMAAYLAERQNADPIDVIIASPMKRASETAAPLAAAVGLDIAYDQRLREFDANETSYRVIPPGEMTPTQVDEILAGFTDPAFAARVSEGIGDVVKANRGQTVAVVCHGGVIMHAVAHLLGAPDLALSLHVENTAISRLMVASSGHTTLTSFGEAPWL